MFKKVKDIFKNIKEDIWEKIDDRQRILIYNNNHYFLDCDFAQRLTPVNAFEYMNRW